MRLTGKILVVEDEATIGDHIRNSLAQAGYTVDLTADGREGLYLATDRAYDAIVMDRMLPGMDGVTVVKALRAAGVRTPVLLLSALSALDDRVTGLRAGGDDYLTKPFAMIELQARLEALLRRRETPNADPGATMLRYADLELDLLARRARRNGVTLDLQQREFKLLEYLLRHKEQVVTRTMLLEGVWEHHFEPQTNVIDVHISRLRNKVDRGQSVPLIHTVRGAGYKLSAQP
jgi:two-component system OmpR family response regulator